MAVVVMFAGKLVIVAAAEAGALFWILNDPQFATGGENELSGIAFPVLVRRVVVHRHPRHHRHPEHASGV